MFDSRKEIGDRMVDAVDLVIDFATLGEYGLEPVDLPPRSCEGRRRSAAPRRRSTGSWNAAVNRFAARA
jgi:hypothetical protein